MSNFWKISCCCCGVNFDLLTDKHTRIICRSCLNEHDFPEVNNVLSDFDSSETRKDKKEVDNEIPCPD